MVSVVEAVVLVVIEVSIVEEDVVEVVVGIVLVIVEVSIVEEDRVSLLVDCSIGEVLAL